MISLVMMLMIFTSSSTFINQILDSTISLQYEIVQDSIHIRMKVIFKQCQIKQGFCGIGFGSRMPNTDMIIITVSSYSFSVSDYYSFYHYYPSRDIDLGGTDDVIYTSGGLDSNGYIDISFKRKLNTGDIHDAVITPDQLMEICWAYKESKYGLQQHDDHSVGSASIIFSSKPETRHFKSIGFHEEIVTHVNLMCVSWGVSITVAVISARYFKWTSWWILIHIVLGSQVILTTLISSAQIFKFDMVFVKTLDSSKLLSSRLGFFILSLCAGQGIFGFLLLYLRWFKTNFQIVAFVTRAHKVVGWILTILGFAAIHLGKEYVGAEIGFYYFMMAILALFEIFSYLQIFFPRLRFYVRKVKSMTHKQAFDLIQQGKQLMFADNLIIDISYFQYTHPGGKYMITQAVGEDTGKYLTGCSSYGGNFLPYEHSEYAFNLLKYLAIGQVPYPKGYLQAKSQSLSQDKMNFLIFNKEKLSSSVWLLTLKSDDFYLADLPEPEWLGKHMKVTSYFSALKATRRYYTSLFANLGLWGKEVGIDFPGHNECPGAVKIIYKEYPGGAMTEHISRLSKGSVITIQGPLGPGLMIERLEGNYLAFAAGTGLVPFLDLLSLMWKSRETLKDFSFVMYLFFKSHEESFCVDLVKKMHELMPELFFLRLIMTQTRKSFIVENEIGILTKENYEKIWLCGPSAFNRRIYQSLEKNRFNKDKIILM